MLFLLSADFLKIFFFQKINSIIMSECQTVQILIGPDDFVGPDLGPNCLLPFIRTFVEFLHFDIQSTGQNSHCVNTAVTSIAMLFF